MTREEIKNTPELVDFLLDKSVIADSREKLRKRLEEVCNLAIKALEQEPCEDAISRQAVLEYIKGSEAELGHSTENELVCQHIKAFPSVTPKLCDDCISRKAVLDYIYNNLGLGDEENGNDVERQMELERSYKYVKSLSSVTPQPKTGRWEKTTDSYCYWYRCSCCGTKVPKNEWGNDYFSPYCPECNAKMVEPQESEE